MDQASALARAIGTRVQHERTARGWTLDQLAEAAEVSRRMLINVEHGATNPSIAILLRISDALGVGLPALVEPPTPPSRSRVTPRGGGAVLWSSESGGQAVLVAGTSPPDVLELWDWTLGAGDRYSAEAHARGTQELIHVRAGSLVVQVADEEVILRRGDAVAFPGDVPHAYANTGGRTTRFSLAVFEPGVGPTTRKADAHA